MRWPWTGCVALAAALAAPAVSAKEPAGDRFFHAPPRAPTGAIGLGLKPYLDDVDPNVPAPTWDGQRPLTVAAAPEETEPATFVVYARRNVRRLDVRVLALRGRGGTIAPGAVDVRTVRRAATRRLFNRPGTEVVGRFLPAFATAPLHGRRFREVWLDVTVPPGTAPGVYTGEIEIDADGDRSVRLLRVRVRAVTLRGPGEKRLGMYYRMFGKLADTDRVRRELADIRAHGVDHLVTDLRPTFGRGPTGELMFDTARIATGMDLIVDAGFDGTVVVNAGLVPLARALGHDDVAYSRASGASLRGETGAAFREQAEALLSAIADEAQARPQLDAAVTHLDEIFGRGRLDLFVELAKVSRSVPLPIYAPFSTATAREDAWRRRVDPLVDIRGNHGYSFEWWIARGNDWDDYAKELADADDRAWFYHNERGTYFTARWARLINGLYLWAGPFESHVTWVYQSFEGDPFDDSDGSSHDFGVAFPDPADPDQLVPTRGWAAVREGYDDLRYIAALREAIAVHGASDPAAAAAAVGFLQRLRADLLRPVGPIDAEKLVRRVGTPAEAPHLAALAKRFTPGALGVLRERVEELVLTLQAATTTP